MVRNGSDVRPVTESEGIASRVRYVHYILLIQLVDSRSCKRRRYIINMFLAKTAGEIISHSMFNQMKHPEETVISSVVTVSRTNCMCPMGSNDSMQWGLI
jgi:hypothetical protein